MLAISFKDIVKSLTHGVADVAVMVTFFTVITEIDAIVSVSRYSVNVKLAHALLFFIAAKS